MKGAELQVYLAARTTNASGERLAAHLLVRTSACNRHAGCPSTLTITLTISVTFTFCFKVTLTIRSFAATDGLRPLVKFLEFSATRMVTRETNPNLNKFQTQASLCN